MTEAIPLPHHTYLTLNDSGEKLQHPTAHKSIDVTDVGLQHTQKMVPSTTGNFLQLVTVQHLQQHFCHSCQNGVSHHVALQREELLDQEQKRKHDLVCQWKGQPRVQAC